MNPEGASLLGRVTLLHAKGNAFEPETQGFPVDEEDDFEGHQREGEGESGEVRGGEFRSPTGEGAEEDFLIALVFVDRDVESLSGVFEMEVECEVDRRDATRFGLVWEANEIEIQRTGIEFALCES